MVEQRRYLIIFVYIFAKFCNTLLLAAEAGLYLPFWSQEILNGATRNLINTGRVTEERAKPRP